MKKKKKKEITTNLLCSLCYLFKYPLEFVMYLVGEENNVLLIIGSSKRIYFVSISYYWSKILLQVQ